jgi:aspartate kinase
MHHARKIMDGVLERHLNAARAIVIEDGHILRNLERDLRGDCEQVIRWLTAVNALGEISPRIRDSVISIGEIMSCRTVVAALLARVCGLRFSDRSIMC